MKSIVDLFRNVVRGKLTATQAAVRMRYDNLCHISELEESNETIAKLKEKNELYLTIIKELQELIIQHSVDVHDSHPRMTESAYRCKIQEEAATHLYRGMETLLRNIQEELDEE
jgi:hypothetical protein